MLKTIKSSLQLDKNFLKGSAIVFAASFVVSILNYFFHLILGRTLGPSDYGTIVAVISFYGILSIPLGAFNTAAVQTTSEFLVKNETGKISFLYQKLNNYGLYFSSAVLLILFILIGPLGKFLNIPSIYIFFTSLMLIGGVLYSNSRGIMQGAKMFKAFSFNIVFEAIVKLIIFSVFLLFGIRTIGAGITLFAAIFITFIVSTVPIKTIINTKMQSFDLINLKKYFSYTLMVVSFIALFNYTDVILAKHFLSGYNAGLYAALSNIGKIILFLTSPILLVMFPMISEAHSAGKRHYHFLAQTLLIIILISLFMLAICFFAPHFIIYTLYGEKFISIQSSLFKITLAMTMLSLSNVFIYYFMSIKKMFFLIILFLGAIIEIALIIMHHNTIGQIINGLLVSFTSLLILLIFNYLFYKSDKLTQMIKARQ